MMNSFTKLNNRGMSIVELMISVGILGLLMAILGMMVSKTMFINRYTFEQGVNNYQLQNALQDISESLREAKQADNGEYALNIADDFDLVFYANMDDDSATERVHYYLENGRMMKGLAEASGFPPAYPEDDDDVVEVGRGIINTASQPIFYYFNNDYPVDDSPIETPANVNEVSLIKIDIYANIDPEHAPDTMKMETLIKPRNID